MHQASNAPSLNLLVSFLLTFWTAVRCTGSVRRAGGRGSADQAGAMLATVLWLTASEALSWYISRISGFGVTYGPLDAAVEIILWFYLSAYATLLGAGFNARLEAAHLAEIA